MSYINKEALLEILAETAKTLEKCGVHHAYLTALRVVVEDAPEENVVKVVRLQWGL